jgi:hypothetical protein
MVVTPIVDAQGCATVLVIGFKGSPGFEWRLTGVAARELRDFLVALPCLEVPPASPGPRDSR